MNSKRASLKKLDKKINAEDAFDNFLSTLSEQLGKLKNLNEEIVHEQLITATQNHPVPHTVNTDKYLHFLEELEAIQKSSSELPEQNKDITNISSQINDELKKFKIQLGRMALEGGGGTHAVQYKNGGFMDGELLVSGDISTLGSFIQDGNNLSDTINELKTIISSNSAQWIAGGSGGDLPVLSGNWENTYTTVKNNSAEWESTYTTFRDSSSSWVGLGEMKFAVDIIGNNNDTIYTYAHGLGTPDFVATTIDKDTNTFVLAAISADDTNITVEFAEPFSNTYRLVAIGAGQPAVSLGTVISDSAKWNSTNTTVKDFSASWGFNLTKIITPGDYSQSNNYTHFVYDDDTAGGNIITNLLPVANHTGVKVHKKIGTTGTVTLSAPLGVLIDGQPYIILNTQYQSIQLYTDGINYCIQ